MKMEVLVGQILRSNPCFLFQICFTIYFSHKVVKSKLNSLSSTLAHTPVSNSPFDVSINSRAMNT